MFKPHKGICICHQEENIIVVKAGYCKVGNEAMKRLKKGLSKFREPIKKYSDKRSKEELLYSVISKNYLKNHPKCEAYIPGICSGNPSNQVHHKKGRIGKLLLDDTHFLAVEDNCHHYIETHPEFAYENGFSESRLKK